MIKAAYAPYFVNDIDGYRYKSEPGLPLEANRMSLDNKTSRPSTPINTVQSSKRAQPVTPLSIRTMSNPGTPSDIYDLRKYPPSPDQGPSSLPNSPFKSVPSKTGHGKALGSLFPSPEQYGRLIQQSLILLENLPVDLRTSLASKLCA
jgi:hypothetical protein